MDQFFCSEIFIIYISHKFICYKGFYTHRNSMNWCGTIIAPCLKRQGAQLFGVIIASLVVCLFNIKIFQSLTCMWNWASFSSPPSSLLPPPPKLILLNSSSTFWVSFFSWIFFHRWKITVTSGCMNMIIQCSY